LLFFGFEAAALTSGKSPPTFADSPGWRKRKTPSKSVLCTENSTEFCFSKRKTKILMTEVHVDRYVDQPLPYFSDREAAGRRLAQYIQRKHNNHPVVLSLPRGGVPVGGPLAEALGARLDVAVARKLPVPHSPEMGFGAVGIDGSVALNENLVSRLRLGEEEIERIVAMVRAEVERRAEAFTGSKELPDVKKKDVFLTDDGIATGYTVMAAAKMIRKQEPRSMVLSVPVAHRPSLEKIQPLFCEVYCLFAQNSLPFAVASFYEEFTDLSDAEVKEILKRVNNRKQ
jgi:putative phosphoribosyl transferase